MTRRVRTLLLVAGLTALPALAAEPEAAKPIPKTVPTTVRLNNDAPYLKALDDLLGKPPADDADMEQKVDHAFKVCSAAFNARKYDVGEKYGRLVLTYYAAADAKDFAEFLAMLHSNLSVDLGKQGKFEEAEKEARTALEIHPDAMHAKLVLPSWLWERGQKEHALAMVQGVKEPDEEQEKKTYFGCLACFYATAEDEAALADNIRKALKADPESKTFFARDVVFDPYRAKPWFIELVGETLAK